MEEWDDDYGLAEHDDTIREVLEHAFLEFMEIDLGLGSGNQVTSGLEFTDEQEAHEEVDRLLDVLGLGRSKEDTLELSAGVKEELCNKEAYYEKGTWWLNRWILPKKRKPQTTSAKQEGHGKNVAMGISAHNLLSSRVVCGILPVLKSDTREMPYQGTISPDITSMNKYLDINIINSGKRKSSRRAGTWWPSSTWTGGTSRTMWRAGRRSSSHSGQTAMNDKDFQMKSYWARLLTVTGTAENIAAVEEETEGREQKDTINNIQEQQPSPLLESQANVQIRAMLGSGKYKDTKDYNFLLSGACSMTEDGHGASELHPGGPEDRAGHAGGRVHQHALGPGALQVHGAGLWEEGSVGLAIDDRNLKEAGNLHGQTSGWDHDHQHAVEDQQELQAGPWVAGHVESGQGERDHQPAVEPADQQAGVRVTEHVGPGPMQQLPVESSEAGQVAGQGGSGGGQDLQPGGPVGGGVRGGKVVEKLGSVRNVRNFEVVKMRKARNVIPDGLVQCRIQNFVKHFPNLRGGGADEMESTGVNQCGKRQRETQTEISSNCKKMKAD